MYKPGFGRQVMIIGKEGVRVIIPFAVLLSFLLSGLTIPSSSEDAANGVRVVDFKVPEGRVKVFLPDDIAAGDTVSAAIRAYPSGSTQTIKNNNLNTLNSFIIETSFFNVPVSAKTVKINVPRNMAGTKMKFTLRTNSMKTLGSVSVPINLSSSARENSGTPSPYDYQCPLVGQAGRLVEIKGPFDGDFATTDFQIGNKKADVLAESPRKLVFESPSDIVGSVEVVLTEGNVVVRRPFMCLQVMKISEAGAVPVSSAAPGESIEKEPPASRAGASRASAEPAAEKNMPEGGITKRELPATTQTLSFESIKAEETLEPAERVEPAAAPPSQPSVRSSNEEKGTILARQMESPVRLENSMTGGPSAPESPAAAVESSAGVIAEESITENPIKAEPEEVVKKESEAPVSPSHESDNIDHTGIVDSGSKAAILEGQLLASFTGDSSGDAAPRTVSDSVRESVARSKPEGSFTVQVASSREKEDADGMAARLRKKGYDAFVVPAEIPGKGKWYRVRVGVFPTKEEAASYADGLKRKERSIKSVFVSEND